MGGPFDTEFPIDVDPEYFRDEEEDVDEGIIKESEGWDDDPF